MGDVHTKAKPAAADKRQPQQVNVHAAKTQFSKLLARVAEGEEIIIAKSGKPVAKLVPVQELPRKRVWKSDPRYKPFAEIDWFARDPEIEKMFYGEG